jgi:NADPH:quinone reductase-like Zn-dependent oxidoreductase
MRAIVQDTYGTADTWRLTDIDRPEIAEGEVLVQVRAAGLDRGTWHLMTGLPYLGRLALGFRKPKQPVPGIDLAGTVVAVGSSVTRFAVGDEVFGIGRGSYAEYAAAREDKLAGKPTSLTFEQAAGVPVSGLTAIQALRDAGRVVAGQRVLVIGASGGVGTCAVQLAKSFGAEVTGVCSTAKTDLVLALGADHVLDYTRDDFADSAERYDLILDIGGDSSLSQLRRALTREGRSSSSARKAVDAGSASVLWSSPEVSRRQLRCRTLLAHVRPDVKRGACDTARDRSFRCGGESRPR